MLHQSGHTIKKINFNPLNLYIYNYNFWFGGINELSTSCTHFAIGSTHELCNSKRSPDHAVASMGAREKGECGSRRWAWVLEREREWESARGTGWVGFADCTCFAIVVIVFVACNVLLPLGRKGNKNKHTLIHVRVIANSPTYTQTTVSRRLCVCVYANILNAFFHISQWKSQL